MTADLLQLRRLIAERENVDLILGAMQKHANGWIGFVGVEARRCRHRNLHSCHCQQTSRSCDRDRAVED